jgi:hypothetical protein
LNQRDHQLRGRGIGTANGAALDVFGPDRAPINARGNFVNLRDVGDDLEALFRKFAQNFFRDRAGRDAPDRFPRGSPAAALPVPDAVFGFVSEVGVRRTVGRLHFGVRFRARVLVHHENRNRRAERAALEDAGQNPAAVRFVARRDDFALAGPAPVEIALNVVLAQLDSRRTTIDDHAHTAAVRFAPGGDSKKLAEAAAHRGNL